MNRYECIAKKYLSGKRLIHSLQTANEAEVLARLYGANPQRAYAAGAVHDIAKHIDKGEAISYAHRYNLHLDSCMMANPALIHGPLGAKMLEIDEGITDREILSAVYKHTTGDKDMSLLEKIIYVADLTEKGRAYKGIDEIRQRSYENLDDALVFALRYVIQYVIKKGLVLHPKSVEAYNRLIITKGKV